MGGLNSYFIRCCISSNNCPENHCKLKITQSNRSFTFNKIEEDDRQQESLKTSEIENITLGFVNVNEASEDALMTLPGVNRKIAHDIILHRSLIGNFKKIEDVALVNGIGAAKFKLIKSEISIDSQRNNSNIPEIFLNEFDIFQFTKIPGFSQTLAERIVSYREKKGPFKSLKDFLKVRGVNNQILNSVRPYIHLKMSNGVKTNFLNRNPKESISDGGSNREEFLQFTTQPNNPFNFYLNVWHIKHSIDLIPGDSIESALSSSNSRPTIIILIYPKSRVVTSKDDIYRLFNEKSGRDNCFNIVQCNVGDSCIHNNDESNFIIFANFEHFSRKIVLHSLIEDLLTCMILTIKADNNNSLLNIVVSFNCPPNETLSNQEAGLSLFNDLALKLKSGNENSFVFLCDSAVKKIADSAFLNNEFHFIDQSVQDDNKENKEFVITTFKKIADTSLSSSPSDFQIKIQQITAQNNDFIIQNDFDVTVLLC